ncbi:hypothetical protein D3C75_1017190 [compost metagenome]
MNGNDFTAQRTQVADLMDHIDQDRATAFLASPDGSVEIVIWFVKQSAALYSNDVSKNVVSDDLSRLGKNWAMRPMMSYEQLGVSCIGDSE